MCKGSREKRREREEEEAEEVQDGKRERTAKGKEVMKGEISQSLSRTPLFPTLRGTTLCGPKIQHRTIGLRNWPKSNWPNWKKKWPKWKLAEVRAQLCCPSRQVAGGARRRWSSPLNSHSPRTGCTRPCAPSLLRHHWWSRLRNVSRGAG